LQSGSIVIAAALVAALILNRPTGLTAHPPAPGKKPLRLHHARRRFGLLGLGRHRRLPTRINAQAASQTSNRAPVAFYFLRRSPLKPATEKQSHPKQTQIRERRTETPVASASSVQAM
jgi:hypothetical protein